MIMSWVVIPIPVTRLSDMIGGGGFVLHQLTFGLNLLSAICCIENGLMEVKMLSSFCSSLPEFG